jgi:hypothetical protein
MAKRKCVRNMDKLRRTQGCLTDSVAYFLNLHPENVPYFVYPREDWMMRLRKFFKKFGYTILWDKTNKVPKRGMYIVCGNSLRWKTFAHVVVYKNGKLVYDPNYPSHWKDNRITHILNVYKGSVALKDKGGK